MSRNDKDFVTRICVTQVLKGSTDPYEHDFYHYVYRSFEQERGGPQTQQQQPGVLASRQAMKRMANNVQRMINNQRPSNENRGARCLCLTKARA